MPSDVQICNLALARLGDSAQVQSINPPDQSAQATYCALFYDMTRQSVLCEHQWGSATKIADLAQTTNTDTRWAYSYAVPSDALEVNIVFPTGYTSHLLRTTDGVELPPYTMKVGTSGRKEIFSDQLNISIQYTYDLEDTTLFHPMFTDAFAWRLAANLAGPILKGDVGAAASKVLMQAYNQALKGAMESDSFDTDIAQGYVPQGILSRA